jgi:hypothetical protein
MLQGNATLKGNGEDVNDNNQAGNNRLLSVAEVATEMGVSPKTVYGWTYREPRLPVKRDGRRVFIDLESLTRHRDGVYIDPVNLSIPQEQARVCAEAKPPADRVQQSAVAARDEGTPIHSTAARSGQRELSIRQREGLGIAAIFVPSFHVLV